MVTQGLSPGGVYEAQFGDHNYQVLWKVLSAPITSIKLWLQERLGFARAALQADVPVLPVFTENIRLKTSLRLFGDCSNAALAMHIEC